MRSMLYVGMMIALLGITSSPIRVIQNTAHADNTPENAPKDSAKESDDEEKVASILAALGHDTFQRYCSSCHGAEGKGDGPIAKVLRTPPANLSLIAKRRGGTFTDDEVSKFIDGRSDVAAHGPRDMPVWGRRFGQRIADDTTEDEVVRGQLLLLVEYLKSIQK